MDENLIRVTVVSSLITNYYNKLSELIYEGNENSDEYYEILQKIKDAVKIEKKRI